MEPLYLSEAVASAFLTWLKEKWSRISDRPLGVAFCNSVEDIRGYSHQEAISYPYVVLAQAGVQLDTDRGGLSRRFGDIILGIDRARASALLGRLTPVKLGIGMAFRSDSRAEVETLLTLIYSSLPGPTLNLAFSDTGVVFRLRVSLPVDVDFSAASEDDGFRFTSELSVVLNSWMGSIRTTGLIRNIHVNVIDDTNLVNHELVYDENDDRKYPLPLVRRVISDTDRYNKTKPNFVGQRT